MSAQHPMQIPVSGNDVPGDEEESIPPMYIKEIDDPDGWQRPDSGYVPFWYKRIAHHGTSPYHPNASTYQIYRNVRDFGATGDGVTLDDDAIEKAMTDGGRCGHGCGSSTTQQAVVYFPPGTYLLSRPIQSYYGTSIVGDPSWRPVLKASRNFTGIALVDENPYDDHGNTWYVNQVNFFRQTRNIVFDIRDQKDGLEAAINVFWSWTMNFQNVEHIHPGIRIVGEAYSVLMGAGEAFNNIDNPRVVFRFGRRCKTCARNSQDEKEDSDDEDTADDESGGNEEECGLVEVSDIVFSTRGPAAGAIVIEWNLRGSRDPTDPETQGIAAMWDTHVILGGFRGSNLEGDVCPKEGNGTKVGADMAHCRAAFLGLHITRHASAYLSGTWVWLADHDLDRHIKNKNQIAIYSGRGVLVENTKGGPVWMYGVGSEHHLLVRFNLYRARNVLLSVPQTETAYFQGTSWPSATETQPTSREFHDPLFDTPSAPTLNNSLLDPFYNRGLGLRVRQSRDVIVYGAGLWSFFDTYSEACSQKNGACQRSMTSMERIRPDANVVLYNLNTAGTDSVLDWNHLRAIPSSFWRNGFVATIARWTVGQD
ncbi:unnamed protein product [Tilletia controversa]|nr:unnamed protein product [Tilletia controversa]CAD6914732.1 unnamed protein product [Tilletia controversa]